MSNAFVVIKSFVSENHYQRLSQALLEGQYPMQILLCLLLPVLFVALTLIMFYCRSMRDINTIDPPSRVENYTRETPLRTTNT
jgi:uncharacterized membrane protein